MSDYLLLAGVALCLVSVLLAVIQLLRLEPPRASVILLILGIVGIFASAYLNPEPFRIQDITTAWHNLTGTPATTPPAQ
jgi:xanthosine utilization system XapX-like protein